jgi:hypothetical protein
MANKPMERCSTPNHHENANQNHIRYYFTPARMVIANMTDSNSVDEDVEILKTTYIAGRNAKWRSHFVFLRQGLVVYPRAGLQL